MEWYLEAGGVYIINHKKVFGRNIFIKLDEVEKVKKKFKNKDCYITAFMYNKKKQDESLLYGPLYLDLDTKLVCNNDFNRIKRDLLLTITSLNIKYNVPFEYIKIYFSGNKGFHIIIDPIIFGVEPHKELNLIYKYIASDLKENTLYKTLDTGIYDNKRLLRLNNTINRKTGLYKVQVDLDFIRRCTLEELYEYAKEPKYIKNKESITIPECEDVFKEVIEKYNKIEIVNITGSSIKKLKKLPICIKHILKNGVTEGMRNNTASILASSLFQVGKTINEIKDILYEWNCINEPPMKQSEILSVINSMNRLNKAGKGYGCSSIKNLDLCIEKCKFNNRG